MVIGIYFISWILIQLSKSRNWLDTMYNFGYLYFGITLQYAPGALLGLKTPLLGLVSESTPLGYFLICWNVIMYVSVIVIDDAEFKFACFNTCSFVLLPFGKGTESLSPQKGWKCPSFAIHIPRGPLTYCLFQELLPQQTSEVFKGFFRSRLPLSFSGWRLAKLENDPNVFRNL